MSRSRRGRMALAAALALGALVAGPPVVWALSATVLASGELTQEANVNNDRIRFKTKDPADVQVQEARFAPGDVVDWHEHPGFALITVTSGTMTFYDAHCQAQLIGPGEAFVESGGPTKAVNQGAHEARFYVTYVLPHGSPRTVPTAPPACA